jgi:uncharacterized delta-60 repeat protein
MNRFVMRFVSILIGYALSSGAQAACTAGQLLTTFGPPSANGYVQVAPWILAPILPFEGLVSGGDSSLYVVSTVAQDSTANYAYAGAVRTSSNGTVDPSYGGFSFVAPAGQASPPENGQTSQITQDRNGKVIVAVQNNAGVAVSRFLSNGMPDVSFGVNGVAQVALSRENPIMGVTTSSDTGADEGADGNVLIAVGANNPSAPNRNQPVVIKLTPAGALDANFGVGGLAYFYPTGYPAASFGRATDLAVLESGDIVVTGRFRVPDQMFVARLSTTGALDTSFGNGGFTILNLGPDLSTRGRKLAIERDGKIISVGGVFPSNGSAANNAAVAFRFNANGSIDSSFGSGGVSHIVSGFFLSAIDVALQDNEKIVVTFQGTSDAAGTVLYSGIARLTGSGQLDQVFGHNGVTTLVPAGPTANSLAVFVVSIAAAGDRIIVSAQASNGSAASAPGATFLAAIDTGEGENCH